MSYLLSILFLFKLLASVFVAGVVVVATAVAVAAVIFDVSN